VSQRNWFEKDFYKVLGVDKDASKEDIKRAYRKLAQKHHPDANKGDESAEARFKEISEAHAILSNEEKRAEYDELRKYAGAGGNPFFGFTPGGGRNVRVNVGDLGDLFGGGGGRSPFDDLFGFRTAGPQQGQHLETEVTLDFDEAVSGATLTLQGGARVRVPAGVGDGAKIRVAGKGDASPNGGPPGDLFVRVRVKDHPVFKTLGNGDISVDLPVTYSEATLGAKIDVPTLDGSVTVKIPPGTENGKTLRVKSRGAPRSKSGQGDLLVKIQVEIPKKLSRKEKEALEKFAEVHTASPREHLERYTRDAARRAS
jgi:molecular chaperone DnaJ